MAVTSLATREMLVRIQLSKETRWSSNGRTLTYRDRLFPDSALSGVAMGSRRLERAHAPQPEDFWYPRPDARRCAGGADERHAGASPLRDVVPLVGKRVL